MNIDELGEEDQVAKILSELDEIKRYAAASYERVDTEISEIISALKRLETKISEMDSQIDRIEMFDRQIQELVQLSRSIERKTR